MKILFTSDWHVDASTAGVERFAELEDYAETCIDYVDANHVDVVCFLGDAFDPGSLREAKYSSFMLRVLMRLRDAATHAVVAIPGNHDVIDQAVPLSVLSPCEAASAWLPGLHVPHSPIFNVFVNETGTVGVLALPYVSAAYAKTSEYENDLTIAFDEAHKFRSRGIGENIVAIGHYTIEGIEGGSEGEMVRGRDLPFPTARMRALAPTLIVNGHYHHRQRVRVDGMHVQIVGAPARMNFAERGNDSRGFLVAEFGGR